MLAHLRPLRDRTKLSQPCSPAALPPESFDGTWSILYDLRLAFRKWHSCQYHSFPVLVLRIGKSGLRRFQQPLSIQRFFLEIKVSEILGLECSLINQQMRTSNTVPLFPQWGCRFGACLYLLSHPCHWRCQWPPRYSPMFSDAKPCRCRPNMLVSAHVHLRITSGILIRGMDGRLRTSFTCHTRLAGVRRNLLGLLYFHADSPGFYDTPFLICFTIGTFGHRTWQPTAGG